MEDLNPYFKMLKKTILQAALVMMILWISMDVISLLLTIITKSYNIVDGNIIFKGNIGFLSLILSVVMGVRFGHDEFNIAMSIRANRKKYLISIIICIITTSLILSLLNESISLILELILETISSKNAIIVNDFSAFNISFNGVDIRQYLRQEYLNDSSYSAFGYFYLETQSFISTIYQILNNCLDIMICSYIGLFIGAITYRLRKITSVILFAGVPILTILVIVGKFITNDQKFINKFNNVFLVNLMHILINDQYMLIMKISIGVFCLMGALLLLKKAPIKEYAYDLI